MNIKELRELIKDLPEDMPLTSDHANYFATGECLHPNILLRCEKCKGRVYQELRGDTFIPYCNCSAITEKVSAVCTICNRSSYSYYHKAE